MLLKLSAGDNQAVPLAHVAPLSAAASDSKMGAAALPAPPAPPRPAGELWDAKISKARGEPRIWLFSPAGAETCRLDGGCQACTLPGRDEAEGETRARYLSA